MEQENIQPIELKKEEVEITIQELLPSFNIEMVKKYPKSNKKLAIDVSQYGVHLSADERPSGITTFISPHGIEFKSSETYPEGTLLKINIAIPEYWERKKRFVEYGRIDVPQNMKLLAKVISSEAIGKRGKKSMVLCRTVNIEDADEQVLKCYLQEG